MCGDNEREARERLEAAMRETEIEQARIAWVEQYCTFPSGSTARVESGRTYEPGPVFGGTPDYLTIRESMLRLCGQRWGLPEHIYSPPDDVQPDHVVG